MPFAPRRIYDENGLTPKQAAFVRAYLVSLNAKQAATEAGYSAHTATEKGHALLHTPKIAAVIAKGKAERSERTKIDADWVLRRLADEAEADLADLYFESGGLKPVHEWPMIWRQGLVAGVDVETLREDGEQVGTVRKIKLSDRVKRLELLGKHIDVQAFSERHEHDVSVRQVTDISDAELADIARGRSE